MAIIVLLVELYHKHDPFEFGNVFIVMQVDYGHKNKTTECVHLSIVHSKQTVLVHLCV